MASATPAPQSPVPIAPTAGGLQFSVRALFGFSVTCAACFGWLRYMMQDGSTDFLGVKANHDAVVWVALCFWPMPLALMGILPRRELGEVAPGLSGFALWRVSAILYPVAYLAASVLLFPGESFLWALALGGLWAATVGLLIMGALVLWELAHSTLPSTRVEWLGLALYLYLYVGLTVSSLIGLLG